MQDLAPPKELYIEVRVLEDVGEIATEEGSVNLEKDTQVRMYPRPVLLPPTHHANHGAHTGGPYRTCPVSRIIWSAPPSLTSTRDRHPRRPGTWRFVALPPTVRRRAADPPGYAGAHRLIWPPLTTASVITARRAASLPACVSLSTRPTPSTAVEVVWSRRCLTICRIETFTFPWS